MSKFPKIIVVFLAVDWNLFNRREMVKALAVAVKKYDSTVIAVNRPLCPFTTAIKKKKRFTELFGAERIEKLDDNLILFSPKYILHDHLAGRVGFAEKLNIKSLNKSLVNLFKKLDISDDRPLVWFNYPQQGYVTDIFKKSFSIYEIYDFLADIHGQEDKRTNTLEKALKNKVDLLLTVTNFLHKKYSDGYNNSYLFGNGISRQTFDSLKQVKVKKQSNNDRPQIGYAGMISERLDWNLIKEISKQKPEWDFVFNGLISDTNIPDKFKNYDNVIFHGTYNQSELPSILGNYDVGALPYLNNEFFHRINPLKFYEYAGIGLPIVSTFINELEQFSKSLIQMPEHNADKWIKAIENQLSSDRDDLRIIGEQITEQYVWDNMCAKLIDEISKHYN